MIKLKVFRITQNDTPEMVKKSASANKLSQTFAEHVNGSISTSNNSEVSALTLYYVASTNDKGCSLFSPIHEKIKY